MVCCLAYTTCNGADSTSPMTHTTRSSGSVNCRTVNPRLGGCRSEKGSQLGHPARLQQTGKPRQARLGPMVWTSFPRRLQILSPHLLDGTLPCGVPSQGYTVRVSPTCDRSFFSSCVIEPDCTVKLRVTGSIAKWRSIPSRK